MIIDTETHVFKRLGYGFFYPDNPLVEHYTWHEHSGDLLIQEMNVAGVDKAICASYDFDDVLWLLKHLNPDGWISLEDFEGGARYTYQFIKKYSERLIWFYAANPLEEGCVEWITEKAKIGLKGVKWLPAFYGKGSAVDGPEAAKMFEACIKLKFPVVLSFEDIYPDAPYTPAQYVKQLNTAADRFPDLKIGLYHAGYASFNNMLEKEPTIDVIKRHNNIYVSTALFWMGEREYPFPGYLAIIKELAERVGVEKMMWATDWPWTESFSKYGQMVTSVKNHATFLNENEKERFLGGTAVEFLSLKRKDQAF